MNETELRRRATLFFRELGIADVAAGLPARTSSPDDTGARPLVDALVRFLQRYARAERWPRWTSAFNAYASAYRRAQRDGAAARWDRGTIARCRMCDVDVVTFRDRVFDHVLTVSHLARAEAYAMEKRAS